MSLAGGLHIIGLAGASGSGKTTVAGMLAAELLDRGFTVKLDAFAVPIKKRIMAQKAGKGLAWAIDKHVDRLAMQNMGTAFRAADSDYFIKCLVSRSNIYGSASDFLIVPDIRYPNEAEFVKAHGVLIHVCGCKNPLAGEAAGHESESHFAEILSGADYAIAEQPNLELLAVAVKTLIDAGEHLKK